MVLYAIIGAILYTLYAFIKEMRSRAEHVSDRDLEDLFRGRLDKKHKRQKRRISAHLAQCESCQERLHEIRKVDNARIQAKRDQER